MGAARKAVLNLDARRLADHHARAGELAASLAAEVASVDRIERERQLRRLPATDAETLASLAIVLADGFGELEPGRLTDRRLRALAKRPLPLAVADIELLVALADGTEEDDGRRAILTVVAAAAERLAAWERAVAKPTVARAVESMAGDGTMAGALLRSHLIMALPPGPGVLAGEPVAMDDRWSTLVAHEVASRCAADLAARAVVDLMAAVGARPTRTWEARIRELVDAANGDVPGLIQLMLRAVLDAPAPASESWWDIFPERRLPALGATNTAVVRGAVWVAVVIGEPWVPALLATISRDGRGLPPQIASACLTGLGQRATPAAVAELAQLWWADRRASRRQRIGRALDLAARRTRSSGSELLEPHVPRAGPPRIRRLERLRLESVLAEAQHRSWDEATWTARYVEHSVTGPLAKNLVWLVESGRSSPSTCVAGRDGFVGLDGSRVPSGGSRPVVVRPWHPFFADDYEVQSWRRLLATNRLDQAVEQVDRPVFRRIADEPLDHRETLRFAEVALDATVARRFLRARGWSLGVTPYRVWSRTGERAELAITTVQSGRLRTGSIRFSVSFRQLSPVFFSEVLLDVARLIERSRVRE